MTARREATSQMTPQAIELRDAVFDHSRAINSVVDKHPTLRSLDTARLDTFFPLITDYNNNNNRDHDGNVRIVSTIISASTALHKIQLYILHFLIF